MFLHADSEDSGQTGRMPRLIWVFVGRTCHFVRFVTRRLICNPIILRYWLLTTEVKYRKCPKYSDTQNICCNHSKIWTVRLYHRVMSPNDADGISNSVDPDQTSLIWVCTVCPGISFRKLRIITACFFCDSISKHSHGILRKPVICFCRVISAEIELTRKIRHWRFGYTYSDLQESSLRY